MLKPFPALLPFAFAVSALAQSGGGTQPFLITQNGKQMGEAHFAVAQAGPAQAWTSGGGMKLRAFAYSFSNTATVDPQGNLVRDQLSGSVHGGKTSADNIHFDAESDATGRTFRLTVNADGVTTGNSVDRHQNLVFVPDLDPAAYTLMARVALRQPKTAWVLIPKENGILVPAEYTRAADVTGTLSGRATPVRHSIAALGGENALVIELFYTPEGELMEADLNAQNLRVERVGWKLVNHPEPAAPPKGQAPEPPPGEQQTPPLQP